MWTPKNGHLSNKRNLPVPLLCTYRFDTTKLLLANGACPFIKNRYGDDALQTACLKGRFIYVIVIMEALVILTYKIVFKEQHPSLIFFWILYPNTRGKDVQKCTS